MSPRLLFMATITALIVPLGCDANKKTANRPHDIDASMVFGDWSIEAGGHLVEADQVMVAMTISRSQEIISRPKVLLRTGESGAITIADDTIDITSEVHTSLSDQGVVVDVKTTITETGSEPLTPRMRFLID